MILSDRDAPEIETPTVETVVSWGDSGAIEVSYLPSPPVVAGVGMRPELLTDRGWTIYFESNLEWYDHMHRRLTRLAVTALRYHRARQLLTSLSLGWETALAEAADGLRLPFIVALPYRGCQGRWHDYHKQRFSRLMGKAEEVVTVSRGAYQAWKHSKAVSYRIAGSDLLLTLWDGSSGSVRDAIQLARRQKKTVINLWTSWLRYGGLKEG